MSVYVGRVGTAHIAHENRRSKASKRHLLDRLCEAQNQPVHKSARKPAKPKIDAATIAWAKRAAAKIAAGPRPKTRPLREFIAELKAKPAKKRRK